MEVAGGYNWRGGRHGLDRAEEEPARSRRAGRRPDGPHAWQAPELATAGFSSLSGAVMSGYFSGLKPMVFLGPGSAASGGSIIILIASKTLLN